MADPYATLGVDRTASEADIKKAYRNLAKELHPDRNKDNAQAADRFGQVANAYDLLGDKEKRARFDRGEIDAEGNPTSPFGGGFGGFRGTNGPHGRHTAGPGGFAGNQGFEGFGNDGVDLGDIFDGLFGQRGGAQPGGGAGGGRFQQQQRRAPQPKGANIAYRLKVPFIDAATQAVQRITLADGKTIDLKLPAGVEDGQQMRLAGKGQQGPGGAGDGIVTIEITPHVHFTRDGSAVRLDLPVTLKEAVEGGKVKVPTVDKPVMLAIPAGTTGGTVLRLKGKGFSRKSGGRGDQLVRIEIDIPAGDTALADFAANWTDQRDVRKDLTG